jgi:hypothetical protein
MLGKSNRTAFVNVAGEPRLRIIIIEDVAAKTNIARTILIAAIDFERVEKLSPRKLQNSSYFTV